MEKVYVIATVLDVVGLNLGLNALQVLSFNVSDPNLKGAHIFILTFIFDVVGISTLILQQVEV